MKAQWMIWLQKEKGKEGNNCKIVTKTRIKIGRLIVDNEEYSIIKKWEEIQSTGETDKEENRN